jgi:UDP-sugar transporter A1/2/3
MVWNMILMKGSSNDDNKNHPDDDDDDATTTTTTTPNWDTAHFTHGVAPILMASFISGLAGALTQKNLQISTKGGRRRNAYLFSMELCVCSLIIMTCSLYVTRDGYQISQQGFFHGWTFHTLIPILLNSIGGILVGLVTQHAGSVRKGFALIFGIFLSGVVQELLLNSSTNSQQRGGHVSKEQVLGGTLAAVSLWMHATNPPSAASTSSSSSPVEETKKTKKD